jgi:hypothetical protein
MKVLQGGSFNTTGVAIGLFFSEKIGKPVFPPYLAIAFEDDKQITSAVIFNGYTQANIDAHIWAPHKVTKKRIKIVLEYVFNQLGCKRLSAKFHDPGQGLTKFLDRLGFKYEATLASYYPEGDAQVFVMDKEAASRWINING